MENIAEVKRCCVFCGRELVGRSDKRFCDDACRNNYGYQRNKSGNVAINRVNKSLLHNRNVLKSIAKCGRKVVKRQFLVEKDFDFEVITGIYKTYKDQEYMMLYDYAYKYVNDEDVLVFKYFE